MLSVFPAARSINIAICRGNEKGRVERAIRYIRGAFFAARQVHDLNAQAAAWCAGRASDRPCPQDAGLHDPHRLPAARTREGRSWFENGGHSRRHEFEQQVQQGDQALAVRMQKAEVARAPQTLGQHDLQDQPQKMRPGTDSGPDKSALSVRCRYFCNRRSTGSDSRRVA